MKLKAIAALAALGTALSGCATIIEGTTQSVAVATQPEIGAHCALANSEGTWYLDTPGNAIVHKTKNDLTITCKKDGFQDASLTVSPHFNGATVGNVLAGGLIGVGVDAATGANFTYPLNVIVPMTPIGAAAAPLAPPVPVAPPKPAPAKAGS
jgi:hypothetical protein